MKFGALILVGLVTLNTDTGVAAKSIPIQPGETVTVSLKDGIAVVISREPAKAMSDFEAALLRRMQMTDIPPEVTAVPAMPVYKEEIPVDPPKVEAGILQITFRHVPGLYRGTTEHSLLSLRNGYSQGLRYRAKMRVHGRVTPTDVCAVMPERLGTEHWPYSIEELDLEDFRFESFDETNPPCQ
jgi:hypothetical protein